MTSLLVFLVTPLWANQPLWAERSAQNCAIFSENFRLVRFVPRETCKDVQLYYFKNGAGVAGAKPLPDAQVEADCTPELPSERVLPKTLEEAMITVGQGVPFIKGLEFVDSLVDERIAKDFSVECRQALLEARKRGPLALQSLHDQSQPIGDFEFAEFHTFFWNRDPKAKFYHYTTTGNFLKQFHPEVKDRAKAHEQMILSGEYAEIFDRNRAKLFRGRGLPITDRVLFVAEDDESSEYHGPHRVNFWLHPQARVLAHLIDYSTVNKELLEDYPRVIAECPIWELYPIFAEGSGIALYDYFDDHQWFTLLSFGFITHTEPEYDP